MPAEPLAEHSQKSASVDVAVGEPAPDAIVPEPRPKPPSGRSLRPDVRLRRLIDEDLGDELDAAMASVGDADARWTEPPVPASATAVPAGKQDKRTVRVLSVRGQMCFVELGGKSEGIVPRFNSRRGNTNRRRLHRSHRRSLRSKPACSCCAPRGRKNRWEQRRQGT